MAHELPSPNSEDGVTLPLVALLIGALVSMLALAIDTGTMFVGNTQLQAVADAAARRAMGARIASGVSLTADQVRGQMDAAARSLIAQRADLIQGGVDANSPSDVDVAFGRFNYTTGAFVEVGGFVYPSAVRVTVSRNAGSTSGPIRRFLSAAPDGTALADVDIQTAAVATLRPRNIVLAVDVGPTFAGSINTIENAIERVLDRLQAGGGGDRVGLVAFRNRVVDVDGVGLPVTSTALTDPANLGLRGAVNRLSDGSVRCVRPQGDAPPQPYCVGTDLAAALDRAGQLLNRNGGNYGGNPDGQDLVVLVTDGAACRATGPILSTVVTALGLILFFPPFPLIDAPPAPPLSPPGSVRGGGSTPAETADAAAALCGQGVSLSTLEITGTNERCIVPPNSNAGSAFSLYGLRDTSGNTNYLYRLQDEAQLPDLTCGDSGRQLNSNFNFANFATGIEQGLIVPPVTVQ